MACPRKYYDTTMATNDDEYRMWRHSATLALLLLPWNLGAQVGPDSTGVRATEEPMPLSAAIAEVRRSPFHAAPWALDGLSDTLYGMAIILIPEPIHGFAPLGHQEAPPDTLASSARLFATAAGVGVVAYAVGGLVYLYSCGSAPPGSSCVLQLALGMSVPVAALGVTARGLGADPGRAALGSILGGAIGLVVSRVDLDQPLISLGLSSVAHAAVTTIAARIHFRRRPRQ